MQAVGYHPVLFFVYCVTNYEYLALIGPLNGLILPWSSDILEANNAKRGCAANDEVERIIQALDSGAGAGIF